jgi:hypothetical protein
MDFAAIVDKAGKITPVTLLGMGVASGLILFVPESIADTLGMNEFRSQYRGWIGATFLFSWSALIAHGLFWGKGSSAKWWEKRQLRNVRWKYLDELTPEEKGYLVPYINNGKNTLHHDVDDGIAGGLMAKDIIFRSSNLFNVMDGVPYNLQPWARTRLHEHPELLKDAVLKPKKKEW